MLRKDILSGINHTFTKVVHDEHSFGSTQRHVLGDLYLNIADVIVLTGFSINESFVNQFAAGGNLQQASLNQPLPFSNITGPQVQNLLPIYAEPLVDYITPVDPSTLATPQALPNGYIVSSDLESKSSLL